MRSADAAAHLPRRLFGEGDRQDRAQGVALFQQVEIARHQRKGFPRPGPGGDGNTRVGVGGGLFLAAFEVVLGEERHGLVKLISYQCCGSGGAGGIFAQGSWPGQNHLAEQPAVLAG